MKIEELKKQIQKTIDEGFQRARNSYLTYGGEREVYSVYDIEFNWEVKNHRELNDVLESMGWNFAYKEIATPDKNFLEEVVAFYYEDDHGNYLSVSFDFFDNKITCVSCHWRPYVIEK